MNIINLQQRDLIDKVIDDILFELVPAITDNTIISRDELRKAISVVAPRHLSRARKDGRTPLLMHQIEILNILVNVLKVPLENKPLARVLVLAALLHDAIEDGDITDERLKSEFGDQVYFVVDLLTRRGEKGDGDVEWRYFNGILQGTGAAQGWSYAVRRVVIMWKLLTDRDMKLLLIMAAALKMADHIHNVSSPMWNNVPATQKYLKKSETSFNPMFASVLERILDAQAVRWELSKEKKQWMDALRMAVTLYRVKFAEAIEGMNGVISASPLELAMNRPIQFLPRKPRLHEINPGAFVDGLIRAGVAETMSPVYSAI